MITNTNTETGIRYGVVSLNSLADWVSDEFFNNGTNETEVEALADWKAENPDATDDDEQEFWETAEFEECNYSLKTDDGLKLELSYLGGAALIWVLESPHIAQVSLCSPCVPNAGDLNSKNSGGFDCYDLPSDWFDKTAP